MKTSLSLIVPAVLVALATGDADARSRHERATITAMKEGGKTVGFRVKLTLRPSDYGHDRVRIGLAPKGQTAGSDYREHASGEKKGFLLHQWKEIGGLKTNQPKDVTLELRYSDAKNLKPGSEIEIVSAWSDSNARSWHVWGLKTSISGPVDSFKLPNGTAVAKPKKPAAKPKKPASRTRTAAKPKKPAAKPKKPASASRGLTSSTSRSRQASSSARTRASAAAPTRAKPKKPRTRARAK